MVPSSTLSDPAQLRTADPLFENPPSVDPTRDHQQATALVPWNLGTALRQQSTSPLVDRGVDPRTLSGLTTELRSGIERWVTKDAAGVARPQGQGWDVGAYER
jgi:hypothetical protein